MGPSGYEGFGIRPTGKTCLNGMYLELNSTMDPRLPLSQLQEAWGTQVFDRYGSPKDRRRKSRQRRWEAADVGIFCVVSGKYEKARVHTENSRDIGWSEGIRFIRDFNEKVEGQWGESQREESYAVWNTYEDWRAMLEELPQEERYDWIWEVIENIPPDAHATEAAEIVRHAIEMAILVMNRHGS